LTEKTIDLVKVYSLKRASKRGGIALICVLVECPHCHRDIWLDIGSHSGDGGNIDMMVSNGSCYECCRTLNLHVQHKAKKCIYISSKEYSNFVYMNFVQNFKNLQNENTYKNLK
jgi:hypothetical protein